MEEKIVFNHKPDAYVDIGRALSYKEALNMVLAGRSVFTVTKAEAKALAKNAYSNKKPKGYEIHNKDKNGSVKQGFYYYHYHVKGHNTNAHIWLLFFR